MPGNDNDVFVVSSDKKTERIPAFKQEITVNTYHYYITGEIGDVIEYIDLINTLKTASENDTVFIYLNTPGGSLFTAIQIIGAMRHSAATVITSLEGNVCSAGTLIFLAADKNMVYPHCTFMIHNYTQQIGGRGNEVAARAKFSEQYFKKLASSIYGGFLTEEEILEVTEGKDLWMDSDEVIARLSARNSVNSAQANE